MIECRILFSILMFLFVFLSSSGQEIPFADKTAGGSDGGLVGAIESEYSVTPTGQFRYEIPIPVIAGTGGMKPNISVTYDSSSKHGLFGYGFDLTGLSVIHRVPSNVFNDGRATAIDFSNTDNFALNGTRLLTSNLANADGNEFRTEPDSYSKIVSKGNQRNPSSFSVFTKSGLEYIHKPLGEILGSDSDSTLFWPVEKVIDRNGNYFTISYEGNIKSNEYYVSHIDYTSNDNTGLKSYAQINFKYDSYINAPNTYIYGKRVKKAKYIKAIEVTYGNQRTRRFEFEYKYVSGKVLLSKIKEFGKDGAFLNPTVFDWHIVDKLNVTNVNYTRTSSIHKALITPGDFNGDGKADFIATPENKNAGWNGWKLFISNGSGFENPTTGDFHWPDHEVQQVVSGDFNGDGLCDIVVKRYVPSGYYNCDLYTSEISGSAVTLKFVKCFVSSKDSYTIQRVEVNGDGVDDIFLWFKDSKKCNIIYSTVQSNIVQPLDYKAERYCSVKFDKVEFVDFNGDGLTDVLNIDNNGNYLLQADGYGTVSEVPTDLLANKRHYVYTGDFNGDGKTDLLTTGRDGNSNKEGWSSWQIRYSKGDGTFELQYFNRCVPDKDYDLIISDLNGDGYDDIQAIPLKTGDTSVKPLVFLNSGIGTFGIKSEGEGIYGLDKWRFYTGDFNGDGKIDMLCTSDWNNSNWDGYQLYLMPEQHTYLLASVTDGIGSTVTVDYGYMSDGTICRRGQAPAPAMSSFGMPWPVVACVTSPDGIGGTLKSSYQYKTPLFHKGGRGFLGFESFSRKDEISGISITETYEFDEGKFVAGLKKSETVLDGKVLSETVYTNSLVYSGTKSNRSNIYNFLPVRQNTKTYEYNSGILTSEIVVENTYDRFGNTTYTSVKSGEKTTIIENTYSNDEDSWCLGRLTSAVVSKILAGGSSLKKSEFRYDTLTGLLTEECVEPDNLDLGIRKLYEHDSYGNITSSILEPLDGSVTRITTSSYDNKGRFMVSTTNSLGFEETYETDERLGLLVSSEDCNGVVTSYSYDPFGSPILSSTDISQTVSTTGWASSMQDAPVEAIYFSYTQTTGKPYKIEFHDILGRVVRTVSQTYGNKKSYTDFVYDAKGQLIKESEPYYPGEKVYWNTNEYDKVGRLISKTDASGNVNSVSYFGLGTTTTDALGSCISRICDSNGNLISSTDNEGTEIVFSYDTEDRCTMVDCGNKVIRTEYDILGNKTLIDDPDFGTSVMKYNCFGEVISKLDPYGTTQYSYDEGGRILTEERGDCTVYTIYDKRWKGCVAETYVVNKPTAPKFYSAKTYDYDCYGRLVKEKTSIDRTSFTTVLSYNSLNLVDKIRYPSGVSVKNNYDAAGFLESVTDSVSEKTYWRMLSMNARGQVESEQYGNGLTTTTSYDAPSGLVTGIVTPGIQNWAYSYDATGNLESRTDKARGLEERFIYDSLHRLRNVRVNNTTVKGINYDAYGNITYKSDVGFYGYEEGNNRLSTIGPSVCEPTIWDEIRYNSLGKVSFISSGSATLEIDYGPDRQCVRKTEGSSIRYYVGKLFEEIDDCRDITNLTYIYAGGKAVALVIDNPKTKEIITRFIHRDNLGSVQAYSGSEGNLLQEFSFDAWGLRRNPSDWTAYSETFNSTFGERRGFTNHEHLDLFCIIDMGGRLYDPLVGRFLSPDPIVQIADYSQGLNRYIYCLNNPLSLTDPSGYSWLSDNWKSIVASIVGIGVSAVTLGTGSGIGVAIIAGAAGGAACALTGALLNGSNFGKIAKNTLVGGVLGAAGAFLNFASADPNIMVSIAKHSFSQGWLEGIQGGNMFHGMLMGAASKIGGSRVDSFSSKVGMVGSLIMNSVLSGVLDELGGGKFANGAVTGAFSYLFNETLHRVQDRGNSDDDSSVLAVAMPIALAVSQIDGPIPGVGDLAALTILTGAAIYYDLTERIYLTYTLTNDAGQVYVGRTSGFGSPYSIMMRRYYGHHMRIFGFKNPTIDKYIQGLNAYGAIRGREQQLIDFYGGIGNPRVANKIRGVSKLNVLKGRSYHEMSNFFFGNIAPYTGY